jgi:hypothetical protein
LHIATNKDHRKTISFKSNTSCLIKINSRTFYASQIYKQLVILKLFIWKYWILNSQGNTEQKQQCWRCHNTRLQTILQSHSNKNNIVLVQKQTWNQCNRRPKYRSMQLCPPSFWQRCQKHIMSKRQALQQMLLGKLDICMEKTETRFMSFTLHKYQFKID